MAKKKTGKKKKAVSRSIKKKTTNRKKASAKKTRTKKAKASKKPSAKKRSQEGQFRELDRKATYQRKRRSELSNIGSIPPIKPEFQELRDECRDNLELWHQEVFKKTTGLKPLSESQLKATAVSKRVIDEGGRLQKIEFRGAGKTSRTSNEALHALLYAKRRFVCICGASTNAASDIKESIQMELEANPILFGMFPEVCYPIWELEGKAIKANSQHINGDPTGIIWQKDRIGLPNVAGSACSESLLVVKSIRSNRGSFKKTVTQGKVRPDLFLLDDIQTDDVAKSANQVHKFINTYIKKGVLRSGGWSKSAAVMNIATIIEPDDVPDTLSRDKSWITSKFPFMLSKSDNEDFWLGPYQKLKRSYRVTGDPELDEKAKKAADQKATELYRKNRKQADQGAEASWEWAYPWEDEEIAIEKGEIPRCISAVQAFYDVVIEDGEETAASELECNPIRINTSGGAVSKATRKQLVDSIISIPRGVVPIGMPRLIAHIDLHANLFYWTCLAKSLEKKNAHVVDYNTWPKQSSRLFTVENAKRTIPQMYPGMGLKARTARALARFITLFAAMKWRDQNGRPVELDEIRVDANWGRTTDDVRKAIRNHAASEKVWGCFGRGKTPDQKQVDDWELKPGAERGPGYIDNKITDHGVKEKYVDTNLWKSETHLAITTPNEENGTLTFFDGDEMLHELYFDSLLVENCQLQSGKFGEFEVFTTPKNGQNHYFDTLVNAMVDDYRPPKTGRTGNTYKL